MLFFAASLAATLLHLLLIFALAPLLSGLIASLRANLLGRRGPPILQPYRRLRRLAAKATLIPENATDYFSIWPFACFASLAAAAALVPSFCTGMVTAPDSDFITFIGLLAIARASTQLAGLETGFGFGGAGAGRDLLFSIFAEAALLVVLISFVLISHSPTVDGIALAFRNGHVGISVSLGFALAASLAVALTETGRIPADNPAGHLELGMVHEAMLLEYSGRYLLLFEYAAMLRLMVWLSLIGTIFFPFGLARAGNPFTWPAGLALWPAKLAVMLTVLSIFEVSTAKMRVFRVPEFLGVAMLLGMLAGIFLFLASEIGS
jgi:formate hydrogenlyase subunit 4